MFARPIFFSRPKLQPISYTFVVETRSLHLKPPADDILYPATMPSKKFLLFVLATLLVMAILVEPSMSRDLMKKKQKAKGKGKGTAPAAPTGTGITAATIKSEGYVLVGNSVFDISSFRHPGGSIINTCKGKDCTALFNSNHNSGALSKASKYKVGTYGK